MNKVNNPEIRKFCLPWKVQDADAFECDIIAPFGSDDYWNVAMVMDSMNNLPSHEIAAFIVRACNSHYFLLEGSEDALKCLRLLSVGEDLTEAARNMVKAHIDILETAITRAKGGQS